MGNNLRAACYGYLLKPAVRRYRREPYSSFPDGY